MTDRLEHHFAAEHQFHRLAQLSRRGRGERTVRPWPQLVAKARAHKLRNHPDVFLRQAEHLSEDTSEVDDSLRRLIQREGRTLPDRGGGVYLERVMGLGRRDVGLVKLERRGRERLLGIA